MKIKSFLFLLTLQLSFISTFFTSDIALATEQQKNTTQPSQITPSLNEKQLPELTQSNSDTKQKSINIETEKKDNLSEDDSISFKDLLPSIIGAFFGTIFGAFSTILIGWKKDAEDSKKQKILNSFELAKDWDSLSMRESRTSAWKVFSEDRKINNQNFDYYYDSEDEQENNKAKNMLRVVDFFDRLSLLKAKKFIDEELAQTIFSQAYTVWHYECFNPQHVYLIDETNKVRKDLQYTFNIIDFLEEWLLNPIESTDLTIEKEEKKHLNQYIENIRPILYQQLDQEDQPEKVKDSPDIIKKNFKDKKLQYIIDFHFPKPIKLKNITVTSEEQEPLNNFIQAISSTLYQELYDRELNSEKVKGSTKIRKKIVEDKQLQYTIDVSFSNPTEEC